MAHHTIDPQDHLTAHDTKCNKTNHNLVMVINTHHHGIHGLDKTPTTHTMTTKNHLQNKVKSITTAILPTPNPSTLITMVMKIKIAMKPQANTIIFPMTTPKKNKTPTSIQPMITMNQMNGLKIIDIWKTCTPTVHQQPPQTSSQQQF